MDHNSVSKVPLSPVHTGQGNSVMLPEIKQSQLDRHNRRPVWRKLREMVAEFFGVLLYVLPGVAATAAMVFGRLAQVESQLIASEASLQAQLASRMAFAAGPAGAPASNVAVLRADALAKGILAVATAARVENAAMNGNLLTVGLAFGLGIAFAIITAAPVSGGHFNPAMTLLAVVFQKFSKMRALRYILAQLSGGLMACFLVYGMYRQHFDNVLTGVLGANPDAKRALIKIFCSEADPTQAMGYMFMVEFCVCFFMGLITMACLDQANPFMSFPSAPVSIGIIYSVAIWAFGSLNIGLNTAKDFPGRIVAAAVIGRTAFTYRSTAWIGTLVNMPALLLAALVYEEVFKNNQKHVDMGLVAVEPSAFDTDQVRANPFEHKEVV